jgi:hypothetical protein
MPDSLTMFRVSPRCQLTRLERDLSNHLPDILEAFEPFVDLRSLFERTCYSYKETIIGQLLTIRHVDTTAELTLFNAHDSSNVTWVVPLPVRPTLVVWRFNDCLDLLQANLRSSTSRIYLQTGGARVLDLLQNRGNLRNHEKRELEKAQTFFLNEVLDRPTDRPDRDCQ